MLSLCKLPSSVPDLQQDTIDDPEALEEITRTLLVKSLGSSCLSLSEPTKGLGSPPLNSLLTTLQGSSPARLIEND